MLIYIILKFDKRLYIKISEMIIFIIIIIH